MIQHIIFDFGGVVLKHKATLIEDVVGKMFPEEQEKALEVWNRYNLPLKTGKKTSDDFIFELKNTIPTASTLEELKQQWKDLYKKEAQEVNWELLELVEKLKEKYNVYLFTDTIDIHDEYNKTRHIYDKFHKVFKSFVEGIAKVEGENAFLYILKKIDANPDECIFIDDLELYVNNAREIGIKGLLFTGLPQLKEQLASEEIEI